LFLIVAKSPKYLKGQLLLDGGKLWGSFFHRTVVLVCQHDSEGAFGLVLNRESGARVGEIMAANLADSLKELPLYIGGPVQPAAMSYLHFDHFLPEANVLDNLQVGHSLDSLIEIGESMSVSRRVRVFAGYSGWAAGQLEDEMKREAWLTHPASLELVFDQEPAQLWRKILLQKGWQYQLLANAPDDPAHN
jgi:putative transcriptional regulator